MQTAPIGKIWVCVGCCAKYGHYHAPSCNGRGNRVGGMDLLVASDTSFNFDHHYEKQGSDSPDV